MSICEGLIENNVERIGRDRIEGDIRSVLRGLRNTADTPVQDRRSTEYYVGVGNDPDAQRLSIWI